MRLSIVTAVILATTFNVATAAEPDLACRYGLKDAPSDAPKFADFPTPLEKILKPASVNVDGKSEARRYRTALRNAAKSGPDFAGHYKIVQLGCGSSCSYWALINEISGNVSFFPEMEDISGVRTDDNRLQFHVDSNLLILVGGPHEDEGAHSGIFYYRWITDSFRLLRFVPADTICKKTAP
jgi:hypothetical protein